MGITCGVKKEFDETGPKDWNVQKAVATFLQKTLSVSFEVFESSTPQFLTSHEPAPNTTRV